MTTTKAKVILLTCICLFSPVAMADEAHSFGQGTHGFLGVGLTEVTEELVEFFGAEGGGVLVSKLVPDGPAERTGLLVGDLITSLDGESVGSGFDAVRQLKGRKTGDVVNVEVTRSGASMTVSVSVDERPAEHRFGSCSTFSGSGLEERIQKLEEKLEALPE